MRSLNLTRADAAARSEVLDVESYDVDIDLTDGGGGPGSETFRSRTVVRFSCARPGAETFIDLRSARIRSATLNGRELVAAGEDERYDDEDGLTLPADLDGDRWAVVAELLRTTARTAIDEHARRPVSMTAVLREAGLDRLAPQSGADVHVLANRAHLVTFLTTTSPMLASEAVVTADSWLVPLSRPDQLGSAGLLALHASGGTLTSHLGGQAAAWSRTTSPVTA